MSRPLYTSLYAAVSSQSTSTPRRLLHTPAATCKQIWVVRGIDIVGFDTLVNTCHVWVTWATTTPGTGTPPTGSTTRQYIFNYSKGISFTPPSTAQSSDMWRGHLVLPPDAVLGFTVPLGHCAVSCHGWRFMDVTPMPQFPLPIGPSCI